MQFYSVVSPKVDALKMDPKFLDRNVNEGFSGGERKRNEILQLSVRFAMIHFGSWFHNEFAWHIGLKGLHNFFILFITQAWCFETSQGSSHRIVGKYISCLAALHAAFSVMTVELEFFFSCVIKFIEDLSAEPLESATHTFFKLCMSFAWSVYVIPWLYSAIFVFDIH